MHDMPEVHDNRDNLTRLLNLGRRRQARVNRRYSFFVRGLRLLLPLVALGIVVVVMAWPRMDKGIAPVPKEDIIPQRTGRNELIDPRFESATTARQPYVITAARAVQSLKDSEMILLEKPVAEITLGPAARLSGEAAQGVYRQDDEILVLDGDVHLRHTNGYTLESRRLNVSMKRNTAWTDQPVNLAGPGGTLQAAGMNADNVTGEIVFNGPAKLVLRQSIKGM